MIDWLRAYWLPILVVAIAAGTIGTVSGWLRAAHNKGIAEANEARAMTERARADSIEAHRIREHRADSLRTVALLDSANARARRAEEALRREAEEREERERARARAVAAAQTLTETLTPAQVPLFQAYVAERDAVEATLVFELESANTRADASEAELVSVWSAMRAKDDLYGIALDENAALRATNESLRAAYEAMSRANSSGGIFPDFGDFTKPVYVGIGAAIVWGFAEVTR